MKNTKVAIAPTTSPMSQTSQNIVINVQKVSANGSLPNHYRAWVASPSLNITFKGRPYAVGISAQRAISEVYEKVKQEGFKGDIKVNQVNQSAIYPQQPQRRDPFDNPRVWKMNSSNGYTKSGGWLQAMYKKANTNVVDTGWRHKGTPAAFFVDDTIYIGNSHADIYLSLDEETQGKIDDLLARSMPIDGFYDIASGRYLTRTEMMGKEEFSPVAGAALLIDGRVYRGERDQGHRFIFNMLPEAVRNRVKQNPEIMIEGFLGKNGKFYNRDEAEELWGGRYSEELIPEITKKMQMPTGTTAPEPWKNQKPVTEMSPLNLTPPEEGQVL